MLGDAAVVPGADRLALSTDAYVVHPLEFPGGDIGELAVNGTVNDLAMVGARPLWLTAGFVIEEGFPVADLRRIVSSMGDAARVAGIASRRRRHEGRRTRQGRRPLRDDGRGRSGTRRGRSRSGRVEPGDRVLLSGTLADHGMAVMVARGDLQLEAEIESDTAALHELTAALVSLGSALRWMRDPTRGGLATALNELTAAADVAIVLDEGALPVRPAVAAACEILGIDPLYVANEGKLIAVVAAEAADDALATIRSHPLGRESVLLGEVHAEPAGLVLLDTALGGTRIVDMLVGDPLPRIC